MIETLSLQQFYDQIKKDGFAAVYHSLWKKAALPESQGIWISLINENDLWNTAEFWQKELDNNPYLWKDRPLSGVPFAVKDNIDASGFKTTAACPAFAYRPDKDAAVVRLLRESGAVVFGKTNLDQFASGLVGLRSPYGYPVNPRHSDTIPGGSSSGSACAVTRGQVCFSLGTDTAGSGRVPAALQGLWGVKPAPGLFSTSGVVPACRSLDCVSIFTSVPEDGGIILSILAKEDPQDPYSRTFPLQPFSQLPEVLLVPLESQREWFGQEEGELLFNQALDQWKKQGVFIREIDITVFLDTARLLYEGPWIAERSAFLEEWIVSRPQDLYPVTLEVLKKGLNLKAMDAFRGFWKLEALKKEISQIIQKNYACLFPTVGRPFTVKEVEEDPIGVNSRLGLYTNFMNLAGLSAVTYPAGTYSSGVPFGVTLFGRGGDDRALLKWAAQISQTVQEELYPLFVCGAHMKGLPLNHELTTRGAVFSETVRTSPEYRLFLLPPPPVPRPSLIRYTEGGEPIEGELWMIPAAKLGSFLQGIPSPLGLGKVKLEDGRMVNGFLGEPFAVKGCQELTSYGGWRKWLNSNGFNSK